MIAPASLPPWNELSHLATRRGRSRIGKGGSTKRHHAGVAGVGVEQVRPESDDHGSDGDLLLLSHGSLGARWTQTPFARKPSTPRSAC